MTNEHTPEWEEELFKLAFWKGSLTANEVREHFIPFIRTQISQAKKDFAKELVEKLEGMKKIKGSIIGIETGELALQAGNDMALDQAISLIKREGGL